jgi:rhodanese-related sulfurtransferase
LVRLAESPPAIKLQEIAMSPSSPPVDPTINDAEFHKAWEEGACVVVDVREPHEYDVGHIPGAVNLPLSAFDPDELPRDKPIVLVCQSGARSLNALRRALAAGVEDIRHYPGGTSGWRRLGGDIEI